MKSVFTFSILIFIAFCSYAASTKTEVVDKIVAVVNSETVLQSQLETFPSKIKKEGFIDDSLLLDQKVDDLKSNKEAQLQYLIREKMIESEVKKQNLSFTEDKLNQEMDNLAKRNKMSRTGLENQLKKQGYTVDEYKKTLKARLERQSFFESEIVSKLRITDEDAYNEFKNKAKNFKPNVNEFKVAQIFFDSKMGGIDKALNRANEVQKKIANGEAFDSLADRFTEEKGAAKGGYLGQFKSGEFNRELESAIGNLEKGEVSKIVRTRSGFHILKVLDKKVSYDPMFLKYKEQIKASLVEKNFKRQLKNWFESKKQDAYIKIYE